MFRGGDYIDKGTFHDMHSNPGRNTMDVTDIAGAKPKRLHVTKRFNHVAGNILGDNTRMIAAGVPKPHKETKAGPGLNDIFKMGNNF